MGDMKKINDEELENVSGGNIMETYDIINKLGVTSIDEAKEILKRGYCIDADLSLIHENSYKYNGLCIDHRDVMEIIGR